MNKTKQMQTDSKRRRSILALLFATLGSVNNHSSMPNQRADVELPRWVQVPVGIFLGLVTLLLLASSAIILFAPNEKAPILAPTIGVISVVVCCWVLEKCIRLISGRKQKGGLMSPRTLRFVSWFCLLLPLAGFFSGYFVTHTLEALLQTATYISVFFGLRSLASFREAEAGVGFPSLLKRWTSGRTEREFLTLSALSLSSVSQFRLPCNWSEIAASGGMNTGEARTYSSRTVFKLPADPRLESRNFVAGTWRLDFQQPDRYHVSQEIWEPDGSVYDEWVTVANREFHNAGLWAQTDEVSWGPLNQTLSVSNLVTIMQHNKAALVQGCQRGRRRYLIIEYANPVLGDTAPGFREWIEASYADGDCKVRVWLDMRSKLLVKGEIFGNRLEVQQVYANYNQNNRVDPPPWINVENGIIVNTKVPILRHW